MRTARGVAPCRGLQRFGAASVAGYRTQVVVRTFQEGDRGGCQSGLACGSGSVGAGSSARRRTRHWLWDERERFDSWRSRTRRRSVRDGALCDPRAARLSRGPLGLGLDAVVVACRTRLTRRLLPPPSGAGLHVFCEKPLAVSVAECDEIPAARDASGRVAQVGT